MPESPTEEELDSFARFFTPLVSDVMDQMGYASGVLAHSVQMIPFNPSLKIAGRAFPCQVRKTEEYIEIDTLLEMVDAIPKDSIVLVTADEDIDAALWGGLMSARAQARGARGAIVNGGIRDFDQIDQLAFPVFGKYRCVKDIRRRGYMHSYNGTIDFDGTPISPNDIVFADANGVVIIPQKDFHPILDELNRRISGEEKTAQGLAEGHSATELFTEFKTF